MRKIAFLGTLVLLLGVAPMAHADTMTVTYDLAGTVFIPTAGGALPLAGGATITYVATGGVTSGTSGIILSGPVSIAGSFAGGGTIFGGGALVTFAGGIGGGGSNFGGAIGGSVGGGGLGMAHCFTAAICAALGAVTSVPVPFGFSIPLQAFLAAPTPTGPFSMVLTATIPGLASATVAISFSEISRHYTASVPEPGLIGMMASGVIGLALFAARRRGARH